MARHPDRQQRVSDAIRRIVAIALHDEVKDFDFTMLTVTRVDVTRDLSEAAVRYSVLGTEQKRRECADQLAKVSSFIQRRVGEEITIHHVPRVRFVYDPSIDHGIELERLFDQIDRERKNDQ
jgi:ribosome-binding factor A